MPRSNAMTPDDYLASLPDDRRATVAAVRKVILANLPDGYVETVGYGMLCYVIPLSRYPTTYNRQPLSYVSLGSQKNYVSLYLMGVYGNAEQEKLLRDGFAKAGRKLDMGKSCVRFRTIEDLPLEVIAETVASTPPEKFIARYEAVTRK